MVGHDVPESRNWAGKSRPMGPSSRWRPLAVALLAAGVAACSDEAAETTNTPGRTVTITLALAEAQSEVSERFLSIAVDSAQVVGGHFWSPTGEVQGGGGAARVDPYDFSRPRLRRMAAELAPAYLRIGGSEADKVFYDLDGDPTDPLPDGYSERLTTQQWDGITDFASQLGFEVLFTLNAGPGPRPGNAPDATWSPDNARTLIEHAVSRDDPLVSWELGNEINGMQAIHGLDFRVTAEQYVADVGVARQLVDSVDPDALLAGPSSAFWPMSGELAPIYPDFMQAGGGAALDVITWHYYPQQSSRCAIATFRAYDTALMAPEPLDEIDEWATEVETLRDAHAPDTPVWLGETGHAQCGGEPGVSETFASSFWWLDELGSMAARGQPVVIRQTLSGSNYGLIEDESLTPRPDYFASLLWRRLMGTRVLEASSSDDRLRSYAHCTRSSAPGYQPGSVTLLAINLDADRRAELDLGGTTGSAKALVLTAPELTSATVNLNGKLLEVGDDGAPPELGAKDTSTLLVPPWSIAFFVLADAAAPACN